jgi:hypothetical protein
VGPHVRDDTRFADRMRRDSAAPVSDIAVSFVHRRITMLKVSLTNSNIPHKCPGRGYGGYFFQYPSKVEVNRVLTSKNRAIACSD